MKNKAFTLLNISGLAVGMAGFILIMLWVNDELSYDKFNEKESRIVRIKIDYSLMGEDDNAVVVPAPMSAVLKNDFPEVEDVVRFREYQATNIKWGSEILTEDRVVYADSTLFNIFTIPLIKGNPKTALAAPNTITISESIANKFFGDKDPIGEIITLYNSDEFEITGVFKDIPDASHFHFNFIGSINTWDESFQNFWVSFNFPTYVLLKENVTISSFEESLNTLVDKYVGADFSHYLGTTWEEMQKQGTWVKFKAQKLRDIHLHSHYSGELGVNGDIKYVYIFITIAIFILLLACINFTNLSTAKAISRSKEIGLNKVFGIRIISLIRNHLSESFIIVFIAHMLAMVLVEVCLPYFNNMSAKNLSVHYSDPLTLLGLFALILSTSLLAGSYPAFYLSRYKPISALRNELTIGKKKTIFRSVMVVGQFVISITLLCSTFILNKQMQYIHTKELGFEKDKLLAINNSTLSWSELNNLKSDLLTNPEIENATITSFIPVEPPPDNTILFKDGIKTATLTSYKIWRVDLDYVETMGMKISNGRGFSSELRTDSMAVLLNETAARTLGWDDPLGKTIGVPGDDINLDLYTVIGVIDDFNFESVHNPIMPLAIFLDYSSGVLTLRIDSNSDIPTLLGFLEEKWMEYSPDRPLNYSFYNDNLNYLYASEINLNKILISFTFLAFFVSCLGLIGLAMFATEQRRKEIGVRKVVGASITQVGRLLSYDFTKLVILAFIIACPISYIIMVKWLENFAYKTNISWWIFAVAGLLSYLTAMIAIGYQSYKASTTNPVETLRDE